MAVDHHGARVNPFGNARCGAGGNPSQIRIKRGSRGFAAQFQLETLDDLGSGNDLAPDGPLRKKAVDRLYPSGPHWWQSPRTRLAWRRMPGSMRAHTACARFVSFGLAELRHD